MSIAEWTITIRISHPDIGVGSCWSEIEVEYLVRRLGSAWRSGVIQRLEQRS